MKSTATAHGRVNLIGEHTDYNGGFVLPTAIPQCTRATVVPRSDGRVRGRSRELGSFEYELGSESRAGGWSDYVQGVTRALALEGFRIQGFDLELESDVPIGAGVSSSAALEIALLRALKTTFNLDLEPEQAARIGQRAENELVGARVGIMDQMAAALCDDGHALFLDTRTMKYRFVPIPKELDLIVIHSGVTHRNAGGDYNIRRAECESACERLGLKSLRDLTSQAALESLPEPLKRRARHVFSENERVLSAVRALEEKDPSKLGRLFLESHRSMRDDYEVSIPEIDCLVEIAASRPSVYGARLTGGGFGGSIVALSRSGSGAGEAREIAAIYASKTREKPVILVPSVEGD